ncbi:hypothetical protein CR513_08525, partial [Mucuna pruriens]
MHFPLGFSTIDKTKVCKLKKTLTSSLVLVFQTCTNFEEVWEHLNTSWGLRFFVDQNKFFFFSKYILDIIFETSLLGAKRTLPPMKENHHFVMVKGTIMKNPKQYHRLVGRLNICNVHKKTIRRQLYEWCIILREN